MVNCIRVKILLAIPSIHEFTIRSIEFVLDFTQSDLGVYAFMDIPLGMGYDVNRGEWVLKLNKPLYGITHGTEN